MGLPGRPSLPAPCPQMEDGAGGPWGAVGGSPLSYTILAMLPFLKATWDGQ